jgi:hypothetical protein
MIKSVNNYPISQIFDIEANVAYVVPRYQREYTWSKTQWESLFDDIVDNQPGYFLGSIICINQASDVLRVQELEVVDGQQRLTTLSLLFAAIYKSLLERKAELDEEQTVELINLKRKLVLKNSEKAMRVLPQIQNNNQDDYRAVLSDLEVIDRYPTPANAGNRKIFRAYRYFKGRLQNNASTIPGIMDFLQRVSQASLVKIEVVSHADAYTLFESLNNRGMPLTSVDLIKNKLLAVLERSDAGKVDYYFGRWSNLMNYLGDDYAVQERFFRQYYNAFRDSLKSVANVPVATRSNLMGIFEKLINHDAAKCLDDIESAGRLYSVFLDRTEDETLSCIDKPLLDLERIQGLPSYVLLLFLITHRETLSLDGQNLADIVTFVVKFFVRRNLTDLPPTRDLTRLFMAMIESVPNKQGNDVAELVKDQLRSVSATDEQFRNNLNGPIYEENYGVTRFVLTSLAEKDMTKESFVDLWRMENKLFDWTIEHIFPQGENIPQAWVEMIADGNPEKAKQIQQTHVHRLGNLTITGFNSTLGNRSFQQKRDRTDRQGRYVGYKNKLSLNADLAKLDEWTADDIEARSAKLIDQAMNLFSLET